MARLGNLQFVIIPIPSLDARGSINGWLFHDVGYDEDLPENVTYLRFTSTSYGVPVRKAPYYEIYIQRGTGDSATELHQACFLPRFPSSNMLGIRTTCVESIQMLVF